MLDSAGRDALKHLLETEKCTLSSASSARENGASSAGRMVLRRRTADANEAEVAHPASAFLLARHRILLLRMSR
ncbi:hypothetical protein V6N13_046563 [Hibiscus sabdariffa]|uniref:Uncharacterized protein n=1 Tax=Hibiscus sabdariffa TaxID=183260 RepID=A0ABR2NZA0_9ROSI